MEAGAWGIWSCCRFSQALEKGVAVAVSFGFHSVQEPHPVCQGGSSPPNNSGEKLPQ